MGEGTSEKLATQLQFPRTVIRLSEHVELNGAVLIEETAKQLMED
jgi:hypothetical protein